MEQAGFDYDNPEGLEGTEFAPALEAYKVDYNSVMSQEDIDEEDKEAEIHRLKGVEQNLISIFNDVVIVAPDPEIEAEKQKAAEAEKRAQEAEEKAATQAQKAEAAAAEKERLRAEKEAAEQKANEREAKLKEIEDKAKLENEEKLYLLNNKRKLDFKEMAKLGIDAEQAPRKFEWNGYVFEQRWMFKEYVILKRPQPTK